LQFSEDGVPAAKGSAASKVGAPVERASLSREKLGSFTDIDALMKEPVQGGGVKRPTPKSNQQQEAAPAKEGGFFGGLMKGRKSPRKGDAVSSGVSIENLSTKDARNFFKKGQTDIARFSKGAKTLGTNALDALQKVSDPYDAVVKGGPKSADSQELAAELQRAHRSALNTLVKTRSDRGKIMEWLSLPAVAFVEESLGGRSLAAIRGFFAPSMVVRNLSVRQRGGSISALGGGPIMVSAEVAVKGTDVEKVALFIGGQRQREMKPGNPDADGYRTFKIRGSGDGIWSLVAFDKYGARPFTKNYAFNSRVRWFRRDPQGEYMIAFRPGSARNSLDRFFYVGGTRVTNGSRDPSISVF